VADTGIEIPLAYAPTHTCGRK